MGPKRAGQAQRTKGNTRASSSATASSKFTSTGFAGFETLRNSPIVDSSVSKDLSPEVKNILRQLSKKDAITRVKALCSLHEALQSGSTVWETILPGWPDIFNKISLDIDRRVRCEVYNILLTLIKQSGKKFASIYKKVAANWICGRFDTTVDVANLATLAFDTAFPPSKRTNALKFCEKEIVSYCFEAISLKAPVNAKDDPSIEAKYCREVSSGVRGLTLMLSVMEDPSKSALSVVNDPQFWKLLKNKNAPIRGSIYEFVLQLLQICPQIFEPPVLSIVTAPILNVISETDLANLGSAWRATILFAKQFPDCWSQINFRKVFVPVLRLSISNCSQGNTVFTTMPCLLPLVDCIPSSNATIEFVLDLLTTISQLISENGVDGHLKCINDTYFEILQYFLLKLNSKAYLVSLFDHSLTLLKKKLAKQHHDHGAKLAMYFYKGLSSMYFWICEHPSLCDILFSDEEIFGFANKLKDFLDNIDFEEDSDSLSIVLENFELFLQSLCSLSDLSQDTRYNKMVSTLLMSIIESFQFWDGAIIRVAEISFLEVILKAVHCDVKFLRQLYNHHQTRFEPNDNNDLSEKMCDSSVAGHLLCLKDESDAVVIERFLSDFLLPILNDIIVRLSSTATRKISKVCYDTLNEYCNLLATVINELDRNESLLGSTFEAVIRQFCHCSSKDRFSCLSLVLLLQHLTDEQCQLQSLTSSLELSEFVESNLNTNVFNSQSSEVKRFRALLTLSIGNRRLLNPSTRMHLLNEIIKFIDNVSQENYQENEIYIDWIIEFTTSYIDSFRFLPTGENDSFGFDETNAEMVEFSSLLTSFLLLSIRLQNAGHDFSERCEDCISFFERGMIVLRSLEGNYVDCFLSHCSQKVLETLSTEFEEQSHMDELTSLLTLVNELLRDGKEICLFLKNCLIKVPMWNSVIENLPSVINMNMVGEGVVVRSSQRITSEDAACASVTKLLHYYKFTTHCLSLMEPFVATDLIEESDEHIFSMLFLLSYGSAFFESFLQLEILPSFVTNKQISAIHSEIKNLQLPDNSSDLLSAFAKRTLPFHIVIPEQDNYGNAALFSSAIIKLHESFLHKSHFNTTFDLITKRFDKQCSILSPLVNFFKDHLSEDLLSSYQNKKFQELQFLLKGKDLKTLYTSQQHEILPALVVLNSCLSQKCNKSSKLAIKLFDSYYSEYFTPQLCAQRLREKDSLSMDTSIAIQISRTLLFMSYNCQSLSLTSRLGKIMDIINHFLEASTDLVLFSIAIQIVIGFSQRLNLYEDTSKVYTSVINEGAEEIIEEDDSLDADLQSSISAVSQQWSKFNQSFSNQVLDILIDSYSDAMPWDLLLFNFNAQKWIKYLLSVDHSSLYAKELNFESIVPLLHCAHFPTQTSSFYLLRCYLQNKAVNDTRDFDGNDSNLDLSDGENVNLVEVVNNDEKSHLKRLPKELRVLIEEKSFNPGQHFGSVHFLNHCYSYLLSWLLMLDYLEALSSELRNDYITSISSKHLVSNICDFIFEILLKDRNESCSIFDRALSKPILLDSEIVSEKEIQMFCGHVYFRVLSTLPVLSRLWWTSLLKKQKDVVEAFTIENVSREIINNEISKTLLRSKELNVKSNKRTQNMLISYLIDDITLEISLNLPANYPLSSLSVESGSAKTLHKTERNLMLQMTKFLAFQNGPIVNAISLWKESTDKKYEGVEECTICYSVIHASNYSMPKLSCRTCKHKFHSACLYKWFQSSNKSVCPLCRSPQSLTR